MSKSKKVGFDDLNNLMRPKAGQHYSRNDGSRIRIDRVSEGQVYYVAWRPGQDVGSPVRMIVTEFEIEIRKERMILDEER